MFRLPQSLTAHSGQSQENSNAGIEEIKFETLKQQKKRILRQILIDAGFDPDDESSSDEDSSDDGNDRRDERVEENNGEVRSEGSEADSEASSEASSEEPDDIEYLEKKLCGLGGCGGCRHCNNEDGDADNDEKDNDASDVDDDSDDENDDSSSEEDVDDSDDGDYDADEDADEDADDDSDSDSAPGRFTKADKDFDIAMTERGKWNSNPIQTPDVDMQDVAVYEFDLSAEESGETDDTEMIDAAGGDSSGEMSDEAAHDEDDVHMAETDSNVDIAAGASDAVNDTQYEFEFEEETDSTTSWNHITVGAGVSRKDDDSTNDRDAEWVSDDEYWGAQGLKGETHVSENAGDN